jgi:hypothetical protein
MTVPPVAGDFLAAADQHITAVAGFHGELPNDAQRSGVYQLSRMAMTVARFLADLPDEGGALPNPEREAGAPVIIARLALARAVHGLRPVAEAASTAATDPHPAVAHLAAAADNLAACRDLLQTHFATGREGVRIGRSYWAPVITSGRVTAALLGELAACLHGMESGIAAQTPTWHASPNRRLPAQRALRSAEPWLAQAATVIQAAQQAHYPLPARSLLDAIPSNTPPPRRPPVTCEPVHDLCEHIPHTAERLRYITCNFAFYARWSPAATSLSWRRDALATAIITHASEIILCTLAARAAQLSLEPAFTAGLHDAAAAMGGAWTSWRAITGHWDIVTTGAWRGTGLTPIAREIDDLVVQTGRLAYCNPCWTPARVDTSQTRDPSALAGYAHNIATVLSTVHHAADAINRIAADDHRAILDAANDNRLYVPTRLLPDTYDIPQPYTPAPAAYLDAILIAYDTATETTGRVTTTLDNLAAAINAPSSILAAARQAARAARPELRLQTSIRSGHLVQPAPGRTEKALRKLGIRDPALLLRSAVIDQAARDLVAEAATKARSRENLGDRARRPARDPKRGLANPVQIAGQDVPGILRAPQLTSHGLATTAHMTQTDRNRPLLQRHRGSPGPQIHR